MCKSVSPLVQLHLSVYLSTVSICLSIYSSVFLFIYLLIHVSVHSSFFSSMQLLPRLCSSLCTSYHPLISPSVFSSLILPLSVVLTERPAVTKQQIREHCHSEPSARWCLRLHVFYGNGDCRQEGPKDVVPPGTVYTYWLPY